MAVGCRRAWRLLRGLASIGSYGLGAFATQQASEAAKKLRRDIGHLIERAALAALA